MFDHGYALLIGVDENKVASLALPIVKKDVTRLQEVVTHPDRCGYPENNVKLLTGTKATRENVLKGLDWLKEKLDADKEGNQTALIYYSGHGHREESGESFLVPYDFRFPLGLGALPAKDFAALIDEMKPRRCLVVLDCCHAEAMGVKDISERGFKSVALTAEEPGIARLAKGDGRAVLSSSRGDQQSWIRKDGQMSVFTYHLIEALTGHSGRPSEPEVLVTEVMDYVARKVPATTHTERDAEQEPAFKFAGTAFPIALVLGGKGVPKNLAAPKPLEQLPARIKGRLRVTNLKGKARVVDVESMDGRRFDIDAAARAKEVTGDLTVVRIGRKR